MNEQWRSRITIEPGKRGAGILSRAMKAEDVAAIVRSTTTRRTVPLPSIERRYATGIAFSAYF